jgi:hypothetical protein
MATNFMTYLRIEPRPYARDFEAGFAAAIHDPVWFLARQWQMDEHQGENASSPVWVDYTLRSRPIRTGDARFDPTITPAEAIVESEVDDWWTWGRRVRIGRRVAASHPELAATNAYRLHAPPPYEQLSGALDGRALWRNRDALGLAEAAFGAEIPVDSQPAWSDEALIYEQDAGSAFDAGDRRLVVQRHRGGRMDWHSVDALPAVAAEEPWLEAGQSIPTQLHYPGAPADRWWQIEDAAVDPGGYVPDSAHTSTAFLTDLIVSHSNDWFLVPVSSPSGHRAGHVVAIVAMEVRDAFDRIYSSDMLTHEQLPRWPGLQPPKNWTLFQVDGAEPAEEGEVNPALDAGTLILWHVAEQPLESLAIERTQFGLDEESNLLWAVERTLAGREVESLPPPTVADGEKFNSGRPTGDTRRDHPKEYAYVPAHGITPYWHPYVMEEVNGKRRLVQYKLMDLTRQKPAPMPPPQAITLQAPQILPLAIPSNGIEIERRWQLARDMDGAPVLWIQRQRRTLLAPPARRLRFDVMEEAAV